MKLLLTSAATALVMGSAAYAESHAMPTGAYEVSADDFYASNLMGMRIYSSEQELGANGDAISFEEQEWDDIGEINDLIISEDGAVQAVIVGVGGFLGIGEKDVAITMDQIRTYDDANGERFLVVNSSKEALESAPGFERAQTEAAMTEGEAAEPGMVDQTEAAATAAATATMAEGETVEAEAEMAEGEMEAEAETEMAEAEVETVEAETEMAEGEVEAEAVETETETVEAETTEVEPVEAETEMTETTEVEPVEGEAVEAEAEAVAPAAGATAMTEVEREGYTTRAVTDLSTDELTGATVYGVEDENIGEVEDLVASDSGEITQAVIGVGGFLGIGQKQVAVNFTDLQILTNEDGSDIRVYISATEDELKALPAYEAPEEQMEAAPEAGMETEVETEVETETAPAAQ